MNITPKFATPNVWCQISGMGRTKTFAAIARGDLKAIKMGPKITLIDVEHGLKWLRSLPQADIKPQHKLAA